MINQIQSVDTGIRAATQANQLEPDEARDLRTQITQLDRAAQRAREMERCRPPNISSCWRSSMM
ncbi:hypothetical protein [Mesorhizobium mediterraneum]|uniref:hypothetical protein n=1 Tax=Mesorhizobium mediterraneum TaxID=43617 RepID=UPI0032B73035